jgi:hypothetical protein
MCEHGPNANHVHSLSEEPGSRWLAPCIDVANATCLNESADGAGARVLAKQYANRTDPLPRVTSLDGGELLFFVPFTETVKLRYLTCIGTGVSRALLWANRQDVDFGNADAVRPTCVIPNLVRDELGVVDYPVSAKFANITSLTVLLRGGGDPDGQGQLAGAGEDRISVSCLGLKGDWTGHKSFVVDAKYEAVAALRDHPKGSADPASMSSRIL